MGDFGGEGAAVDEYNRVLLQEAMDLAVADAEREVSLAWAAELVRMRELARVGLAEARTNCREAWAGVCAELSSERSPGLSLARLRLAVAQDELRQSIEAARTLLGAVIAELRLISLAAEEREGRIQANRLRTWTAWCEAFDQDCQSEAGPVGGTGGGSVGGTCGADPGEER